MDRFIKERLMLLMGTIFMIALMLSLVVTVIGGVYFLIDQGMESMHYETFVKEPPEKSSLKIWQDALSFSPLNLIMLGILILILAQLLRIALVAWYYLRMQDFKFLLLSLFLLAILAYSLFWKN